MGNTASDSVKRFYIRRQIFPLDESRDFSEAVQFVEQSLKDIGYSGKIMINTLLSAEEVMGTMVEQAEIPTHLNISVKKLVGDAKIEIRMRGPQVDPCPESMMEESDIDKLEDADAERAIRSIILKAQGENVNFSYFKGINKATVLTGLAERSLNVGTITALVLGILFGMIMKWIVPEVASDYIASEILEPLKNIFMNGLKMIIAPVVFFSIVSCVSQFDDIRELGKIGAKVMGFYFMTTIIASVLSLVVFMIARPGEWGFALSMKNLVDATLEPVETMTPLEMIEDIVPTNFVDSFVKSDTLEIIFLAVMCGIAVGMVGEYSDFLKSFFESCNSLFMVITSIIAKFIPIAVFCSMAIIFSGLGSEALFSISAYTLTCIAGVICMLVIYGILVLCIAHLNPITFYKKNKEGMLTTFSLSSSSAAMPVNMRTCTEKLGISPRISNFTIPLGATINMDGGCVFMVVTSLFLARAFAIEISIPTMISAMFTIILISMGAPGVPGSGILCIGVVLEVMGIPLEGVGIVIGIGAFLDMCTTVANATGDVVAALIVAKSEGLVDIDIYNSKTGA